MNPEELFKYELELLRRLHDQIKSHPPFDVIIGLSRGGLVPAVQLSHTLNIPMVPVQWALRDHSVCIIPETTLVQLVNRRILIVEDINDSGASFSTLTEELKARLRPTITNYEICTAALYQRSSSAFSCDFVGEHVSTDHWVDFSWEVSLR